MNAGILQMISIVAFILGGILLTVAALLFFVLDVRGLMDDLSGRTAERQIQQLREQNRQQEDNNEDRLLFETHATKTDVTAKLPSEQEERTTLLSGEESTTLLSEAEEGTTVLQQPEVGTTLLEDAERTTLPTENSLILNVIIIHTKERI